MAPSNRPDRDVVPGGPGAALRPVGNTRRLVAVRSYHPGHPQYPSDRPQFM